MSLTESMNTHGRARLSFASEADIDEFVETLEKYERGELTPDQWRTFRLVRGTYGQRQTFDAQMLRIKVPQGVLTADQLRALAEVAEQYSRRFGHITTRQNIQLHFVKLHDVEPAMRRLADAGLTTREACGNSIRNITACPYAGVAHDELFDVSPYAEATTRYFLRQKLSSTLPRKFKIAFEGCPEDHAVLAIHDLAFHAQRGPDQGRGFRVLAGGGTALMCKSAGLLHDFLPAAEILRVVTAVLRVFQRLGDYQHAAPLAEEVRKYAPADGLNLVKVSCCYALCAAAVKRGKSASQLSVAERDLRKRYEIKALETLRQAIDHGYQDWVFLEGEPDLAPIHALPEFKTLMDQLRAKQKAAAK